jgi:hypothetical protein
MSYATPDTKFRLSQLPPGLLLALAICWGCAEKPELPYNGLPESWVAPTLSTIVADTIIYHPIRVDSAGKILPWYSAHAGISYDHVLRKVWNFWNTMEIDSNGMPYYMNHQVWDPGHDPRGLGGDQLMMALSSWDLYYNYTGDPALIENMKKIADYYLAHSLSSGECQWPHLPFPYNMDVESGEYDGDMILGKDYLQPDKAGSLGYELVHLYKKTDDKKYLQAAVNIANTLASKVQPGDDQSSPWPFKVNAITGETGILIENVMWYEGMDRDLKKSPGTHRQSSYTTNWTPALNLFSELIALQQGDSAAYQKAIHLTREWLLQFPAKTNRWGPFFEDIPRWSDTQINAITYAQYVLEHPEQDPQWKERVNAIFQWVHRELDDPGYMKYGVIPVDEQTAYRKPGNSHSARQASIELMYWEKTGDTTYISNAVRQLHWATYMVGHDGQNFYPTNAVWMTDGYGDYVRHYLRAMAAAPQLAPAGEDHLLRSSEIVKKIVYTGDEIAYEVFGPSSREVFRLASRPAQLRIDGNLLDEVGRTDVAGWTWQPLRVGGILRVNHNGGRRITISR